jgi:hypothetical protein
VDAGLVLEPPVQRLEVSLFSPCFLGGHVIMHVRCLMKCV